MAEFNTIYSGELSRDTTASLTKQAKESKISAKQYSREI